MIHTYDDGETETPRSTSSRVEASTRGWTSLWDFGLVGAAQVAYLQAHFYIVAYVIKIVVLRMILSHPVIHFGFRLCILACTGILLDLFKWGSAGLTKLTYGSDLCAFCSTDCRDRQIMLDEQAERTEMGSTTVDSSNSMQCYADVKHMNVRVAA
ncbi:hypothetical protein AMTR_s00002p00271980 [Amborella trichopoda]|uniref:FLZ-type domain-containing protein n=1 Tax=Amborella trichopoda TaxID=13333 RepID=W1P1X7_AMBTC|nr:hypothetical protein AMTR_s00002p00271980 [Amborella trichopoda]